MPKRPPETVRIGQPEAVVTSPRSFGGGVVICRRIDGSFAYTDSEHSSPSLAMPDNAVGPVVLKMNVSTWVSGDWIWPDYYTADLTARFEINGQVFGEPWARMSRTFGEIPADYGSKEVRNTADNQYATWGRIPGPMPMCLNYFLTGITSLSAGSDVGVHFTNNSSGNLRSRIRFDINLTLFGVVASQDQYTLIP